MKRLALLFVLFVSPLAGAQIQLPIYPVSTVSTTTISGITLYFADGQSWVTVVRPYMDAEGRWGRFIDHRDMQVELTYTGYADVLADLRTYLNDLRVTGDELEAAGTSLGIDWAVAKGNEEMVVMMQAFLTKVASIVGQDANWVAAVRSQLLSQLGGP